MVALPSVGAVTLTISMNAIVVADSATGFGTIIGSLASGQDPLARSGDVQREFQLPPGVLTTLVEAPDIVILGSVFEGGGPWEQWFNRIVITVPWQDRYLEIAMRENLQDVNMSKVPRFAFKTLDITMGYAPYDSKRARTRVAGYDKTIPWDFLGQHVSFRRMMRHHSQTYTTIGKFPRECVDVAGHWLHLYICSAPSTEYYGHQRDLSIKYAHLDMAFIEVRDYTALTGLLPELWDVHPMSESTRALVKSETKLSPATGDVTTVWAGGLGMENITKTCFEQNETGMKVLI